MILGMLSTQKSSKLDAFERKFTLNVVLISWKNLIVPGIIHIVYCIPFYTSSKKRKTAALQKFYCSAKLFSIGT